MGERLFEPLALATVAAPPPPPRPAPAASTTPASPAPQTTDPRQTKPPLTPATSNSLHAHTQPQIEEPSSVRSEEKLSWSSDDEEEDSPVLDLDVRRPDAPLHAADLGAPGNAVRSAPGASASCAVPESPMADVRRPEAPPHATDPRAPGKIAPRESGVSAASTGIQAHSNGFFKLQSEIVVPERRARDSSLSGGRCSTLPRPSFKDVLLGQRCSSDQGARRRPLLTEQDADMALTSELWEKARPSCVPDESEGWQIVQPRRRRPRPALRRCSTPEQQVRRARYLNRLRGRCFNCLGPPRRRSLFQRLRWPADKERHRERSPRRQRGEGSRHGGRRHDREQSLSPVTRRSRERSLEREAHRVFRRVHRAEPAQASKKASGRCKQLVAGRGGGSDAGAAGAVAFSRPVMDDAGILPDGDWRQPPLALDEFDPMDHEALLLGAPAAPVQTPGSPPLVPTNEQCRQPLVEGECSAPAPPTTEEPALEDDPAELAPVEEGIKDQLKDFISAVTETTAPPILNTPVKKKGPVSAAQDGATRRSGRLAEKMKKKGAKTTTELAQDLMLQKMGSSMSQADMKEDARAKLINIFGGPLTEEKMEAIEDLLMAMKLDGKKPKKGANKKKVAPLPRC
ncbi:hypothetical protein EJB05_01029, partial [Eragrostis curvula]